MSIRNSYSQGLGQARFPIGTALYSRAKSFCLMQANLLMRTRAVPWAEAPLRRTSMHARSSLCGLCMSAARQSHRFDAFPAPADLRESTDPAEARLVCSVRTGPPVRLAD